MQDLGEATAVEAVGDGRYRGVIDRRWEIWGPMGGYVASMALRAAGAESAFARPASFACHYLTPGRFEAVDLTVERLRSGRTAESLRVSMTQGERRVLEAVVWTVAEVEPLEHDDTEPPAVADPGGLANTDALLPPEVRAQQYPFWENLEQRPIDWEADWPPDGPRDPRWRQWLRFQPAGTFADPWVDACRSVIILDVVSWPSAHIHHAWKWPDQQEWVAPTLDLYVAFHEAAPESEWLLADGHAPVGGEGLIGWNGRLWSQDRRLVASAGGQMLARRVAGGPA